MVSGDLASVSDVYQIEANKKKFLLWQEMGRAWHFLQKWLFLKKEASKKKKKKPKNTCRGCQNRSKLFVTGRKLMVDFTWRQEIQSSRCNTDDVERWKTPPDFKTSYKATDSAVLVREQTRRPTEERKR